MIELIPAIDIIDGKCVRLTKGDYTTQKVYNENPVEVAKEFESYGFKRLHVVDLDGARLKRVVNHSVLDKIASETSLTIDFGGGVRTSEDIGCVFDHGASLVTVGSVAVSHPELLKEWIGKHGSERIILGADVKDKIVSINGWLESGNIELISFLQSYLDMGIQNVLCTDISKDGMLQGPSLMLYKEVMASCPCHLIASGGVSSMQDIVALDEAGIPAVVFGKAIYEGKITLKELAVWAQY